MNNKNCLIVATFLFLLAYVCVAQTIVVTVENPSRLERKSETIAIPLKHIEDKLPSVEFDKLVVADKTTGMTLISQLCEGELLFQSDFLPRECKRFTIREGTAVPMADPLVDGRFVLPREDYAWENDRVAFRMYGPALASEVGNGIDVWTKSVRYLIVQKWYKESEGAPPGKDTYHEDRGEGADFFAVGKSLGAGSSGLWYEGRLHQPGVFSSQRTIANGPIRVMFELTYDGWKIDTKRFRGVKRISLDAGHNLNKIHISLHELDQNDSLLVACGLVKRANTSSSHNSENAWLSLWGLTTADSVNGFLGTGIVVPQRSLAGFVDDANHYLVLGEPDKHATYTYYAGAGWTRSGDFANENEWKNYLDSYAQRIGNPMEISITSDK